MKGVIKHKIGIFAAAVILSASGSLFAQTERITTDASQAVPVSDDLQTDRQKPRGKAKSTSEQFKRFVRILPTDNKMGVMTVTASEPFGVSMCRLYEEEFAPQFDEKAFAGSHIRLSADEFAIAYLLFEDEKVKNAFKSGLELANERAAIKIGATEKSYAQILVDKKIYGGKSEAKQAVKNARKKLEQFAD